MGGPVNGEQQGYAAQAVGLASAILARPSTSPDGLTAKEAMAPSETAKPVSVIRDILNQVVSGRVLGDAATGVQALTSLVPGEPMDDRKLLMESLIARLAKMDSASPIRQAGIDQFLKVLWNDMPHPVTSLLSDEYIFRQPDGSKNNLFCPELGAAGQPYARTVPPMHPKPPNLPDPGLVFDCLLKRDKFVEQPSGISSLMFAFATLIIHTIFSTDYKDPFINRASSYLDMSVLYGSSETQLASVRVAPDSAQYGYGLLKPDCVAEKKLFVMPPAVTALLTLFNRHHNYLAHMLFKINEGGEYEDPAKLNDEQKKKQDHRLFNFARNINSAYFVQIILHDYVTSILGINREKGSDFFLDAGKEIRGVLSGVVSRGSGNTCSVEFNFLYRWHAVTSKADAQWTVDAMERIFQKPYDQITQEEFRERADAMFSDESDPAQVQDPMQWSVPGLKRDPATGKYSDDELAKILTAAVDEPAGAFGAHHTPAVLKPIDVRGMISARKYGVCSMNEFRAYFGLKPFDSFLEWCGDEEVAAVAEQLYNHIDDLELYPGLMAEQCKPGDMLGSGLAPGYTISRVILSDAVALVRGDRFYTSDYNSTTLTSWGMEYLSSSLADGAHGGVLKKMILRTLPDNFEYNSTYALFPFQTPSSMQKILTAHGLEKKYLFTEPKKAPQWKAVKSYAAADAVLRDHLNFGVVYTEAMEELSLNQYGFYLGRDNKKNHDEDRAMMENTVFFPGFEQEYKEFYAKTVRQLIKDRSWKIPNTSTYNCDFVRDIGRMASAMWAATYFGIPIKTKQHPLGLLTLQEFYLATAGQFIYVFMNWDAVESYKLKEAANKAAGILRKIVEARVHQARGISGYIENYFRGNGGIINPGPQAIALYKRLNSSGRSVEVQVSLVMGILTASSQNQGQAAAQIMNLYMSPEYAKEKQSIMALANKPGEASDEMMLRYTLEAQRLDPQTPGIPRFARRDAVIKDGNEEVKFKAGDRCFVSLVHGNLDPEVWDEPQKIKLDRPMALYRLFGFGMHNCQGWKIVNIAQPIILREMMKLKNLRRAPGKAGHLARFTEDFHGTPIHMYLTENATLFPFPENMCLQFEA